jgi:XTP/dITP diphosphohydrolase
MSFKESLEERKAVFKSNVSCISLTGKKQCILWRPQGYIGFERHGTGGFGYDPFFFEPRLKKYIAELSVEEKNALSHRGKAVLAMKNFLNVDFYRKPGVINL